MLMTCTAHQDSRLFSPVRSGGPSCIPPALPPSHVPVHPFAFTLCIPTLWTYCFERSFSDSPAHDISNFVYASVSPLSGDVFSFVVLIQIVHSALAIATHWSTGFLLHRFWIWSHQSRRHFLMQVYGTMIQGNSGFRRSGSANTFVSGSWAGCERRVNLAAVTEWMGCPSTLSQRGTL